MDKPFTETLQRYHTLALKLHVTFSVVVSISAGFSPDFGDLLSRIALPFSSLMEFLYPRFFAQQTLPGRADADFYKVMSGETLFFTLASALAYGWIGLARLIESPAKNMDSVLARLNLRAGAGSTVPLLFFAVLVSFLCGSALLIWCGFAGPGVIGGALKWHQFMVWSLLMPGAAIGFVLSLVLSVSAIASLMRSAVNAMSNKRG